MLTLDLFISPLKAFYNKGILIENRVTIFKRYIRKGFWLDLIGFLALLIPYIHRGLISNIFKLFFLTKFYELYYLDQYVALMIKNNFKRSHFYSIFRVVYIAFLWAHYLGIGFYKVSEYVYLTNYYGPNTPNVCWIYNSSIDIHLY